MPTLVVDFNEIYKYRQFLPKQEGVHNFGALVTERLASLLSYSVVAASTVPRVISKTNPRTLTSFPTNGDLWRTFTSFLTESCGLSPCLSASKSQASPWNKAYSLISPNFILSISSTLAGNSTFSFIRIVSSVILQRPQSQNYIRRAYRTC